MADSPIKQMSAVVPIFMPLGAVGTVLYHVAMFGIAPQNDEGVAAHIWQLLMAGQTPVVAFYTIKWLSRAPKGALAVLGVQLTAALAAMAPVYWLRW